MAALPEALAAQLPDGTLRLGWELTDLSKGAATHLSSFDGFFGSRGFVPLLIGRNNLEVKNELAATLPRTCSDLHRA